MIKILGEIPREIHIAVSGGPDSMAVLDFLKKNHDVTVMHFDHGTDFGKEARKVVEKYCKEKDIPLITEKISRPKKNSESPEEYWRNERNSWFKTFDFKIATAHNLDDVVEWYIFTSLHGNGRTIPYANENIIRPFLLTPKTKLADWVERKNVPFVEDPANKDRKYSRSTVRHDIIPHALKVNPGLYKTVRKMIEEEYGDK